MRTAMKVSPSTFSMYNILIKNPEIVSLAKKKLVTLKNNLLLTTVLVI